MKKIFNLMAACVLASTSTFAQFAESGEVTKVENGVYYVVYETGEVEINYGNSTSYTLNGPGDIVSFSGLKTGLGSIGNFYLYADGTQIKKLGAGDFKRNTYQSYTDIAFNSYTATTLKFDFPTGGSYSRKIKDVKVTMAQYLEGAPATLAIPEKGVNESNSASFDFKWCNLGDITITSSNPSLFKVSTSSVAATQGKWGKTSVTVTCTHNAAGAHSGTITISGGGKTQTVSVTSSTKKNTATISWNIPENLAIDEVVENAASIGSAPVTLTLTSSDENILKVEGTTVTAVGVGSAVLTATIAETANYYGLTETRTINVADKERQEITWEQNIAVIPTTTATVELTATTNSGLPLTYTSSDPAVATVNGNILTIVGVGRADITVSAEGNETYFPAYMTKGIVVYDPNAACPDVLLYDGEFQVSIGAFGSDKSNEITWETGKAPATLTFSAQSNEEWLVDNETTIEVAQKINGAWSNIQTVKVKKQSASTFADIALDRQATAVRFLVQWNESGTTVTFTNVEVKQLTYLESSVASIAFNPINLSAIDTKEITLNFSALASMCGVSLEKEDKVFSVEEGITFGEGCGSVGTKTFTLTFSSQGLTAEDCATYENAIIIANSQGGEELRIPISGAVEQLRQTIDWEPAATELRTIDSFTVPTLTSANLPITYTSSDAEIAYINEAFELVVVKKGSVTLTANAAGDDTYQAATAVAHTFTINPTSYAVTINPITTILEYGEALSTLTLTGSAIDEAGNTLTGTFAFANPEETPASGTAAHDVIFTPENINYYDAVTAQVTVTVNTQAQTIDWEMDSVINVLTSVTVPAVTSAGLPIVYTSSDATIAYVDEAYNLIIVNAGEVTITATADGDASFTAAEPVTKTITITKVVYEILIDEPIEGLEFGQPLSSITLIGSAYDEFGNQVAGSLAFATPDFIPSVSGIIEQDIVFTPDNLGYYDVLVKTVQVLVSEPIGGEPTGLQNATSNMLAVMTQANGMVLLSNVNQSVAVYSVTGTLVYSGTLTANASLFVPAETGMYVVRTANAAQKVSVR